MDIEKIAKLLQRCDLQELHKVETVLADLIRKVTDHANWDDQDGSHRRSEKRFESNLLGTLTRLTDVKPGERKEYSVTIQDISRSGMCLRVDANFTASRVVRVMFGAPGGQIKRCNLEVVRMRKMSNQDGTWLEVGCRSVNNEEVRRLCLYEEQIAKARGKLHRHHSIIILVVGNEKDVERTRLVPKLKNQDYNVRRVDSLCVAMQSAEKTKAQLLIVCNGSELCNDAGLLQELQNRPVELAIMAIIKKHEHRAILLAAGVDECLDEQRKDEFLFHAIERAMVGHSVRHNKNAKQLSGRVLIYSIDNTRVNMMAYQLNENGYSYRVITDMEDAAKFTNDPFDLVVADYDSDSVKEFKKLRTMFSELPVVAMCEDISLGQQAIVNGANDYLCMPPGREDIRMVLELATSRVSTP
jgi:DNA-binding response OmpR family regulator